MVAESRAEVKTILEQLVIAESSLLHKPDARFLMEGTAGVLLSGSTNLTRMALSLKEPIAVKHTHKRLQRMIPKPGHLETVNRITLKSTVDSISDNTILALDGGDLTHLYGDAFEDIAKVKDGSTGRIENGYRLNQITGFNRTGHETFPVAADMYGVVRNGFKSAPLQSIRLVEQVVHALEGRDPLWVMDRGYDSRSFFSAWVRLGIPFITRMCGTRHVVVNGNTENIRDTAESINRRYTLDRGHRFGYRTVHIPLHRNGRDNPHPFTLIAVKGTRSNGLMWFLTSGAVRSSKEIRRRLKGYFRRWSIEEAYRFEKQGFGIEKALVRSFHGIRSLWALSILAWLVLVRIQQKAKLRESVLSAARPVHEKPQNRPRFLYYRLLRGLQLLFEGVKRVFRFRLTREQRSARRFHLQQRPLWDHWLKEAEIMG